MSESKDSNADQFSEVAKSQMNIAINKQRYVTLQDKITLANGVATGILQLESLAGFSSFLIVYLLSLMIYAGWICKCKPGRYYENVTSDLLFDNFTRELFGFVMAWTFSYALIG